MSWFCQTLGLRWCTMCTPMMSPSGSSVRSKTDQIGNADPDIFSLIARGDELVLPNLGLEMVHHVHADDVAQWIIRAIENRSNRQCRPGHLFADRARR